ncbi:MAG: hypothetical protein QOD02_1005 [Mycobacterium sp.]|nr:hypothetical protein [Mycobacterium sp.]
MADVELDSLYWVQPDAFTTQRTKLVAAARQRGGAAAAKRISAARKPTTAAWIVNRLALRHKDAQQRLADLTRVGVAGDPGIDLGPGSFQPGAQLIGLGKFGGWEQSRSDEQLPVDRQLPPGPRPPVRAKAVVGEHKDVGAGCSGHRSGGTSGVRGQRIGLSQRTACCANLAGRAEFGIRGAPPRQGEVRPLGEQEKRLPAGQRHGLLRESADGRGRLGPGRSGGYPRFSQNGNASTTIRAPSLTVASYSPAGGPKPG